MRKVARVLLFALVLAGGCEDSYAPRCTDGVKNVSVNEELASLDGESPKARFDRTAKAWDCTVTWLSLPEQIATQEPAPSSSALELVLERTSDTARYREYAQTPEEKYESSTCQTDAVFVPCALGLASDDGALDEAFECDLRLQGENTLVHLELADYAFTGTHAVSFVSDIPVDTVELNLAYTPGADPTRIDGSIVEYGTRSGPGVDPFVTTAVIECTEL